MTGAGLVRRLIRHLGGQVAVADLLGVPRERVAAWADGREAPPPSAGRRVAALVAVLDHAAGRGEEARRWLHRPSAALDGAVPLDVALVDGPARVLDALADEVRR